MHVSAILTNNLMRKFLLGALLSATIILPGFAHAATGPDLSIRASSIRFSKDALYAGDTVRIYATIKNGGETDAVAQVFFYQGAILIGGSQAISVVADGSGDDVYVDFTVPTGSFNIRAVIQGADPEDTNSSNDSATTPLYHPLVDEDRDGVEDDADNCKEDSNKDQKDTDKDGKGDECDSDDDNDGLSDSEELKKKTSPTLKDTDGDGVDDAEDEYPTDGTRSKKAVTPVVAPVVKTEPPKTSVVTETKPVVTPVVTKTETVQSPPPAETIQEPEPPQTEDVQPLVLGAVKASPDARFTYKQIDWRTYEFEATPAEGEGGFTYGWDFGDGATSVQQKITHAFPQAGSYTVTLGIVDRDGEITSDAQVLDISFFHLDNPLVQLTLGLLLVILFGLGVFIFRLRRSHV
jgi:hypothetical protein